MQGTQSLPASSATVVAKKHYSVREIYRITELAARTVMAGGHTRCDRRASERIMLAVTEVNGCALCSYGHTRLALDMGLSDTEVRALLGGVTKDVPADQLAGVAYGQHYADSRGHPDPDAWASLVGRYGEDRAHCVLQAVRMIMWGNATGIPLSSLRARLRGAPDPASSVFYEIGTTLGAAMITPVALTHALLLHLRGLPIQP